MPHCLPAPPRQAARRHGAAGTAPTVLDGDRATTPINAQELEPRHVDLRAFVYVSGLGPDDVEPLGGRGEVARHDPLVAGQRLAGNGRVESW